MAFTKPGSRLPWQSRLKRWLRFFWRRLWAGISVTPLEVRRSLGILRARYGHGDGPLGPYVRLAKLFLRLPWSLPCVLPPPPRAIMAYAPKQYMYTHHADLLDLRLVPLWRWNDTPQRSFFRLYEAFCAGHEQYVGYETEYFYKHAGAAWAVDRLRDPREYGCADAEQLAVMASLAEALAESFNWRLMWGWQRNGDQVEMLDLGPPVYKTVLRPPPWTAAVPRLEERLVIHDMGKWRRFYDMMTDEETFTGQISPFDKRNIEAGDGSLRTV